jgi:hypothetical protein
MDLSESIFNHYRRRGQVFVYNPKEQKGDFSRRGTLVGSIFEDYTSLVANPNAHLALINLILSK